MASSTLERYRNNVFGGKEDNDNGNGNDNNNNNDTEDGNSTRSRKKMRSSQLQDYLQSQRLTRATLSRHELQQHTDVKFFVSSHFANLISYVAVLGVAFCIGWMGWGRDLKGSYQAINSKYQTILTPVFWMVPTTWIIVFIAEGVYIGVTFIKRFSHLPIIEKGVGFHFFFLNCSQIGWIISYCMDIIWLACLWMTLTVIFLIWLNYRLYYQDHIDATPRFNRGDDEGGNQGVILRDGYGEEISLNVFNEFLIFRFPFQFHLAWGMFLLLMSLNELVLYLNSTALSQIALMSIVILWLIGLFVLFYPRYPIFIIPLVISWCTAGVWVVLQKAPESLLQQYDAKTVERMLGGIISTCIEHAIIATIRFLYFFANSYSVMQKPIEI